MNLINVALDVPLMRCFSYSHSDILPIGTRVLVEFGKKPMVGFVWEINLDENTLDYDIQKIKPILQVFPEIITKDILDLVKFTTNYYHYPLGQTLFNAIPGLMRKPKILPVLDEVFSLTAIAQTNSPHLKSKKQQELYRVLTKSVLDKSAIKAIIGATYLKIIKAWQEKNILIATQTTVIPLLIQNKIKLNPEQQVIFDQISQNFQHYHPSVLYGITGSGKTEVYLQLIEQVIHNGAQALVLVPEINLTPQLLQRFKQRFPNVSMHILTSNVTDHERLSGYLGTQVGTKQIIIGTRLAVFTPFKHLGIIIVDEEHDQSFKQNDGLHYMARDLAVWRAKTIGIPIVLGSATPSLETLYNVKLNKYTLYKMGERAIENARLPIIKLIDLNVNPLIDGLTAIAACEIEKRLETQELSLVFINRRGYSPIVVCYECGWAGSCQNCSTNMVYHKGVARLKCHHCGWNMPVPKACPKCKNQYLHTIGQGTQKIEEGLATRFPNARIYRIDQDTTNTKVAWNELYQKIHKHEVDILVGTQMLAKGHDFHNLTLVVGLNIDSGLYSYDFRAPELLFTQLTQVAGRSGRGVKAGLVLLQTHYPKHELYQYLIRHDFGGFINYLFAQRKALQLPPYSFYVLLRASGHELYKVMEYLNKVFIFAEKFKPAGLVGIYPPVPAIIQRLKNRERGQILFYSQQREVLHGFLNQLTVEIPRIKPKYDISWILDVDPLEI